MSTRSLPIINLQLCNLCQACVRDCPEKALSMGEQGPEFNHPLTCTYCTACEAMCATGAIRTPLTVAWFHQQ